MARHQLRGPGGRFVTEQRACELMLEAFDRERQVAHADQRRPSPTMILRCPTDRYPRWRLRVFDLCWPWRASRGEAMRDARMSHNAYFDRVDRVTYLDAAANIQRDPPLYAARIACFGDGAVDGRMQQCGG